MFCARGYAAETTPFSNHQSHPERIACRSTQIPKRGQSDGFFTAHKVPGISHRAARISDGIDVLKKIIFVKLLLVPKQQSHEKVNHLNGCCPVYFDFVAGAENER